MPKVKKKFNEKLNWEIKQFLLQESSSKKTTKSKTTKSKTTKSKTTRAKNKKTQKKKNKKLKKEKQKKKNKESKKKAIMTMTKLRLVFLIVIRRSCFLLVQAVSLSSECRIGVQNKHLVFRNSPSRYKLHLRAFLTHHVISSDQSYNALSAMDD